MKRCVITLALAVLSATPLLAQEAAAPAAQGDVVVATVNGQSITAAELDRLWNRMGAKMRAQYDKVGNGKMRFLENYVGKRLLLQRAAESKFDQSPAIHAELEAAREAALFDLYVREVVASQIVTEAAVRKYYDDHPNEFVQREAAKVRVIMIDKVKHSTDEALRLIGDVMKDLYGVRIGSRNNPQTVSAAFAAAARKSSEHASAAAGGDLGWVSPNGIDPKLGGVAFNMAPGTISGILDNEEGMYLVLVEDRRIASMQPYESARAAIREQLLGASAPKVMDAVNRATRELLASSKVTLYPENVQ
jgi:EpsD family peptidyl-prolyl cis-trans isomerase